MKRSYLFFLVFSFFQFSCTDGSKDIVIDPDKMADILLDISLAEGYAETFLLKDTTLSKDSVYQKEINKALQFHNTTPSLFSRSYTYYTNRPLKFKEILDSSSARASRRKEEAFRIENKSMTK